jgi:hypothetical protein
MAGEYSPAIGYAYIILWGGSYPNGSVAGAEEEIVIKRGFKSLRDDVK